MAQTPRIKLSAAQVQLLHDALRTAPASVRDSAARIAEGAVPPDAEVEPVVDALADALDAEYSEGAGLTERGNSIDDIIGVVQQMSESSTPNLSGVCEIHSRILGHRAVVYVGRSTGCRMMVFSRSGALRLGSPR